MQTTTNITHKYARVNLGTTGNHRITCGMSTNLQSLYQGGVETREDPDDEMVG